MKRDTKEYQQYSHLKNNVLCISTGINNLNIFKIMEQKTFNVVLARCNGGRKLPVVKAVKENLNLGLKEAKDIVDTTDKYPVNLKEGVSESEAYKLKKAIEDAGGIVRLDQH